MDDSEGIATISKLTQEKFRYDCLQKPTADMIRISRWPTITRVFKGFRQRNSSRVLISPAFESLDDPPRRDLQLQLQNWPLNSTNCIHSARSRSTKPIIAGNIRRSPASAAIIVTMVNSAKRLVGIKLEFSSTTMPPTIKTVVRTIAVPEPRAERAIACATLPSTKNSSRSVSYTHLTLPTIYSV